jgi:hypothetical protein
VVLAASAHVVVPFALAGGSLIFGAFVVVLFFAVVYGYYTAAHTPSLRFTSTTSTTTDRSRRTTWIDPCAA